MGRRRRRKRGRPGPPGAPRRRSRSALRALLGPRGAAVPLAQAFQRLGGPSGPPVAVPRELRGVLAVLPASGAPPPPPGASGAPPALSGSARRGLQGALARVLLRAARRGRWEDALPWAGRAHPWEGDGARGFAPPGSLPPHFLLSPPWVQLLRRAGAPRLEALLARCPVFAPTGGRGYLQVGGPPVLERLGSIGGPRLTEPPGPRPAGGKSGAPAPARAAPPADFVPGGVSGGGAVSSTSAGSCASLTTLLEGEGHLGGGPGEEGDDDGGGCTSGGVQRLGKKRGRPRTAAAEEEEPQKKKRPRRPIRPQDPNAHAAGATLGTSSSRPPRHWRPPSEQALPRAQGLFYCWKFPKAPGLPPQHCLAQALAAPRRGAERLAATIFGGVTAAPSRGGGRAPGFLLAPLVGEGAGARAPRARFLPRRGAGATVPLLRELLANFGRCPFPQLLGHYCPAKADQGQAAGGAGLSCAHRGVELFLRACVARVVPAPLLGCEKTRRALGRALSRLVRAKRYTQLGLQEALRGVRTSSLPWGGGGARGGGGPRRHQAAQRATQAWVAWLLGSLALPLLAANFYVTEAGHSRQRVFYFRRRDWAAVCAQARRALSLREGAALRRLSRAELARLAATRRLGFGQVRVLPKGPGTRPLVNLSKGVAVRVQGRDVRFPAVNRQLRGAYLALRLEAFRRPELLGASVFSFAGAQERLVPYLARWKRLLRSGHTRPFIVSVDVRRAFDTIPARKLWPIVCGLLREPAYALQRYASLAPGRLGGGGRVRVMPRDTCTRLGEDLAGALGAPGAPPGGPGLGSGRSNPNAPGWHALCAPRGGAPGAVHRQAALRLLRELLFGHVVRLNGRFFRQGQGIPQGSLLSTLLCSLLYAEMEGRHGLAPAGDGGQAIEPHLVRWVDDFLFISPSQEQAEAFAGKMAAGIPEYGCSVNVEKTASNFDLHLPGGRAPGAPRGEVRDGAGNRFVPWCGLLLNCETLDVQHDYSRYVGGEMSAAITVSCGRRPMRRLGARLVNYLQAKALPIVLDSAVNSALVVQVNLYQLFLFAAIKCHCYVKAHGRAGDPSPAVFDAVALGVEWAVNRCRSLGVRAARGPEVRWLGLRAFLAVFRRKRGFHARAAALLAERLRAPEFRGPARRLAAAVSPARHAVFAALSY